MTTHMRGTALAASMRARVRRAVETLADAGTTPTLGTVLMSADAAATSYMDRKHEVAAELGVETSRIDVDPTEPAATLYRAVETLAADDEVTALFVQTPLPGHVDAGAVRDRVPASKDVDCFAHANLGRLVGGDPQITPATAGAVLRLLDAYDVATAGQDVVIVGRTTTICKPLANLLFAPGRDGTVTVCHSNTRHLGEQTRRADVLVTAAGEPGLVDGSMLSEGVSVVDISVNRVDIDERGSSRSQYSERSADMEKGYELVGDVDFESATEKASAITPVPGGVGPLTLSSLLRNVVDVTARTAGVETALEP